MVKPLFSVKWRQGTMGNPNPVSENLLKQALIFFRLKSHASVKGLMPSSRAYVNMVGAANVDQQKRMLTSLSRIKHLEWSASTESRVDRSPWGLATFNISLVEIQLNKKKKRWVFTCLPPPCSVVWGLRGLIWFNMVKKKRAGIMNDRHVSCHTHVLDQ